MVKQSEMKQEGRGWTPWTSAAELAPRIGCAESTIRKWAGDGADHFGRMLEKRPKAKGAPGAHTVEYRASLMSGESYAESTALTTSTAPTALALPSGLGGILAPPVKPAVITPRVRVRHVVDLELERLGRSGDAEAHAGLWRELYRAFELFHGRRVPRSTKCKGSRLDHVVDELGMGEELYGVAYRLWIGEVVA